MKRELTHGFMIYPRGLLTYGDMLVDFRKSRLCDYGYMAFHVSIRARDGNSAKQKARRICDTLEKVTCKPYDFGCASLGAVEKVLQGNNVVVDLNDDNIMSFSDVPF